MKYLALLRGINVGGNNMIKMSDLKKAFEDCGFQNVATYINSGNVIFESKETDTEKITSILEKSLSKIFHYESRLIVLSHDSLKSIVTDVPKEWKGKHDLRCYVAFIKIPTTPKDVLAQIEIKEGVDFVQEGKNAIYMSTKLSGLTKSGYTKLIGKKIYHDITIRNFNTTQKLLALMEGV